MSNSSDCTVLRAANPLSVRRRLVRLAGATALVLTATAVLQGCATTPASARLAATVPVRAAAAPVSVAAQPASDAAAPRAPLRPVAEAAPPAPAETHLAALERRQTPVIAPQ